MVGGGNPTWRARAAALAGLAACAAASVSLGLAASHFAAAAIAGVTLLPWLSQIRWVGLRRAITEPSIVTIVLIFYTFVFPLRGLAIAVGDLTEVDLVRGAVSEQLLVTTLALASVGTAALVEAFHLTRARLDVRSSADLAHPHRPRADLLAGLLGCVALAGLALLIVRNHGLAGTQARFLSHNKTVALGDTRDAALSAWTIFASPAVWCAALVAIDVRASRVRRLGFVAVAAIIVLAQILIFGSRLSMLLALTGVWVVLYYSGRTIPLWGVLTAALLVIVLSVPIVSQRPGGDASHLPAQERYSRIAGYAVLDASLAVRQSPGDIRAKLRDSRRWLDFPLYLVPSAVWPGKPSLDDRRMDVYVARSLGRRNQQATGFPTSYLSELWLFAGWPGVVVASLVLGGLGGLVHRKLLGISAGTPSTSSLLWYCFAVTCAFGYYKDGDILLSIVADARSGLYLALAMLGTGVWAALGLARRDEERPSSPEVERGPVVATP